MLQEEKERISQLSNRLKELDVYRVEIESIKSEINKISSTCEHPFLYIGGWDRDYYEGRTYAKLYCPDCYDHWEERSCHSHKDYLMDEDFDETSGHILFREKKLKNTNVVREKILKRMNEMERSGKKKACKVLLDKYKELVSEM